MSHSNITKTMSNAAASVEMEDFSIDKKVKVWCEQLLREEITMDKYIELVKQHAWLDAQ